MWSALWGIVGKAVEMEEQFNRVTDAAKPTKR
jgi:hypothetical protein